MTTCNIFVESVVLVVIASLIGIVVAVGLLTIRDTYHDR